MWRLLLGLVLAPAGEPGSVTIQAPAEPVVWAFDWEAPAECPTRADVIEAVRSYLPDVDEPPSSPGRAELRIAARVSNDGDTWTAEVRTRGPDGNADRHFSALACTELADAIALITAVALDPVLVARRTRVFEGIDADTSEPEPEPEPAPVPAPVPELVEPSDIAALEADHDTDPLPSLVLLTETPDPAQPARDFELGIGVQGIGSWGPSDSGFGGLAGSFAVFAGRWRWQLDGGWWIPRTQTFADERRARIQGWWLGTRGCVVPRVGAVELPLCPGIEAGQVIARGLAPTTNVRGGTQPWLAILVSPGLRWAVVDRLALTADATLLVSLVRGRFLIGDEPIASMVPVGFRGALGLEVRF